jgi:hypothetical protein
MLTAAEATQIIDLAAVALSIITFSVAAIADLRTREVQDRSSLDFDPVYSESL